MRQHPIELRLLEATPIGLQYELAQARRPENRRHSGHLSLNLGIEAELRNIDTRRPSRSPLERKSRHVFLLAPRIERSFEPAAHGRAGVAASLG